MNTAALLSAARACADVVDKRSPVDVMKLTRLVSDGGWLTLSAMDATTQVSSTVPFDGSPPWTCGVDAVGLAAAAKSLPGDEVDVAKAERMRLTLASGSAKIALPVFPDKDMPAVMPVAHGRLAEVDAEALRCAIARSAYCIDTSIGAAPHMSGLLLRSDNGMLAVAGVCSHRIAESRIPFSGGPFVANVPHMGAARMAALLGSAETARVGLDGDRFVCVAGDSVISIRTIGGQASPYERVIEGVVIAAVNVARFNRKEMLAAVERAGLMSDHHADRDGFRLALSGGTATVSNSDPLRGDASTEVPLTHPATVDVKFILSWRYLAEALGRIESDEVLMRYDAALMPFLLRAVDGENQAHIIAPRDK